MYDAFFVDNYWHCWNVYCMSIHNLTEYFLPSGRSTIWLSIFCRLWIAAIFDLEHISIFLIRISDVFNDWFVYEDVIFRRYPWFIPIRQCSFLLVSMIYSYETLQFSCFAFYLLSIFYDVMFPSKSLSKCSCKYFTVCVCGICTLFIVTSRIHVEWILRVFVLTHFHFPRF